MIWAPENESHTLPSAVASYFALHASRRQWRAMLQEHYAPHKLDKGTLRELVGIAMRQREKWLAAVAKARRVRKGGAWVRYIKASAARAILKSPWFFFPGQFCPETQIGREPPRLRLVGRDGAA